MIPFLSTEEALALAQLDRRRKPRIACPARLIYLSASPRLERYRAYVCNFSPRGLGLVTDHSFDVGTVLSLEFERREVILSRSLTAKVVRRMELSGGMQYFGCRLSRTLSEEEQHALQFG
jgi:hypothetical protein